MSDDNLKNRMITNAPDVGFDNVHSAHQRELKKGPDLPPSGGSDGIESVWIRCKQCSFPIDTTKTSPGSPWGNTPVVTTYRSATVQL